jgi:hypothetical protein
MSRLDSFPYALVLCSNNGCDETPSASEHRKDEDIVEDRECIESRCNAANLG